LADFNLTKTLSYADKKDLYGIKHAGTKVAIRYDDNAYNNIGKIIHLGQYSFTLVGIDGGQIGSQTITIKDSSGRNGTMACYKVDNSHFKWTITWADGSQPTDIVVDMSIASQT
jgi:hypothetical protein